MIHSTNKYSYWLLILLPFFMSACQASTREISRIDTSVTFIIAIFGVMLLIIPFIVSKREKPSSEESGFMETVALFLLVFATIGVFAWSLPTFFITTAAFEGGFYLLVLIDLVLFLAPTALLVYIIKMWRKRTTNSLTDYDSLVDDNNNTK